MSEPDIDERRLAFGSVADMYERARPSYPPAAIDGLCEYARLEPGARVLEVGAGTGKATRLLAERGLLVTALEPDPAMAALARAGTRGIPGVAVEESGFEQWRPSGRFRAVLSFQAWHWIDPAVRYERAAQALEQGGSLAAIWTFPDWESTALTEQLTAAYARAAPGLAADFTMHPASRPARAREWATEIAGSQFTAAEVRRYPWSARYSAQQYCELLQTHQDHILMDPGESARLLPAVEAVIGAAGGIELQLVTHVCLARLA